MEALMPIITQLIAGAVGGNVAGAALKQAAVILVGRSLAPTNPGESHLYDSCRARHT